MKLVDKRFQDNFISYVDTYYDLNPTNEKKGIRQIHHNFNKQKSNRQKSSHEDYFSMTFSDHSNGLASTIV